MEISIKLPKAYDGARAGGRCKGGGVAAATARGGDVDQAAGAVCASAAARCCPSRAMEADNLRALTAAATWHGHSSGGADQRRVDNDATSGTLLQLHLGRWPLILEAHLLLVRSPNAMTSASSWKLHHGDCHWTTHTHSSECTWFHSSGCSKGEPRQLVVSG